MVHALDIPLQLKMETMVEGAKPFKVLQADHMVCVIHFRQIYTQIID